MIPRFLEVESGIEVLAVKIVNDGFFNYNYKVIQQYIQEMSWSLLLLLLAQVFGNLRSDVPVIQ